MRITEEVRGLSDEERAMTSEYERALEETTIAPKLKYIYDEICQKGIETFLIKDLVTNPFEYQVT